MPGVSPESETEDWYSEVPFTVNWRLVKLAETTGLMGLTGLGSEVGAEAAEIDQVVTEAGHDDPLPVGAARTDPGVADVVAQFTDTDV